MLNPIALAIPVFFACIGVEAWVARRRGLRVYRFVDSITDLSCGVANRVLGLLLKVVVLGSYVWAYEHWNLIHYAAGSVWPWVLAFVGFDFLYYWWHRLSHEINVLWAAHIVHHQSEDYNLAVALRQAWFTDLTQIPFYLPLALLGVPPLAYGISASVSLLYQFWIHTELIHRVGAFERALNTPSHHRVHHATNPQYLDKNYGAILIIWDRLFGTFEPEVEPCVYGITKPFGSFNPVWANFHYFGDIARLARSSRRWTDKLLTPFRRPGWNPESRRLELPSFTPRKSFRKFEPPASTGRGVKALVTVNFALVGLAVMALLLFDDRMPFAPKMAAIVFIVLGTLAWSGLFERKRWALPLELIHLAGGVAVLAWALA